MAGDTRVTSPNSVIYPLYNGKLTFERTFLLLLCVLSAGFTKHSHRTKELMRTFDADYVNHNNHMEHAERTIECIWRRAYSVSRSCSK